jgi:predicted nuclease of predicted toxin-antitoxin system
MKVKLDENLPRRLKRTLSSLDHDVTTAEDEQLLSQPDVIVAMAARAEGRMLMTLDVEFGDLRKHAPGSHPGIILFRPKSLGLLNVARFVAEFVRRNDLASLTGCVVVVEPSRVRVRRPRASLAEPPE